MKIGIASDHKGYKLKQKIINKLRNKNYDVIDYGTNSTESVDYNDFAIKISNKILEKDIDYGILICGTGIGMSIVANKIKGIRCAKISNINEAKLCRKHNNANIIAISSKVNILLAQLMINKFLHTPFSNEERHIKRMNKIDNM